MKHTFSLNLIFLLAFNLTQAQEMRVFEIGEKSKFDSLRYSGVVWALSDSQMGDGVSNEPMLQQLVKLYPEGVVWERSLYKDKFESVTDRWFVIRDSRCLVFERLRWSWGGVFGYLNGNTVKKMEDFQSLLEREIGKPVNFSD